MIDGQAEETIAVRQRSATRTRPDEEENFSRIARKTRARRNDLEQLIANHVWNLEELLSY